jgi:outer membrane protein assembly factor BamE (lipoprotein component of BamABCDE complex)
VTYRGGKVSGASATINGQPYQLASDSAPGSLVTKANFDMIRGGMTKEDLQRLLGAPTQPNAKPDARGEKYVSDKGSAQVWENGAESITVLFNPDGKAAAWKANFIGQGFDYKSDPQYVVKPADAGTKITKDNFDKIRGGLKEFDVAQILGPPTNPNAQAVPAAVNFDKVRTQVWQNGADSITVTFCNNKAAEWEGTVGGEALGPKKDDAFVLLKNNPNTAVTKANYDMIVVGQMNALGVAKLLGAPASASAPQQVKQGKIVTVHQHMKWVDGQGGEITVFFIDNIVSKKENNGKLK